MYHGTKPTPIDAFLKHTPPKHQSVRLVLETLGTSKEYLKNS